MNTSATTHGISNFSVFLLGAILNILAAVDYHSMIDYSVKAVIGGIIWLAFKIVGEMVTIRMNRKRKDKGDEHG